MPTSKLFNTQGRLELLEQVTNEGLLSLEKANIRGNEYFVFKEAPSNLREQVDPIAVEIYQQLNDSTQKSTEQPTLHLEDKNSTTGKLQEQPPKVQSWQTPSASEHKYRLKGTTQASQCLNAVHKGYLNPRWVEQLMGLPVGWTKASCSQVTITEQMSLDCSETESFLIVQQKLSKPCGQSWPTPAARDWKCSTNVIPPCTGHTRGMTLTNAIVYEKNKSDNVENSTPALKCWGTPTHRDYKGSYPLHGLIRKCLCCFCSVSLFNQSV